MKPEPSWKAMWHRSFKPVMAGSVLIALATWIVGFSFWLFPWTNGEPSWWCIPHLATTLLIAMWPFSIGLSILDRWLKRGDE